ncbi:MAG: hypothetical protein V8T82_03180 [Romboutsia timonensis]
MNVQASTNAHITDASVDIDLGWYDIISNKQKHFLKRYLPETTKTK